ncbi:MAG: ATP-binding cassette domain-containing protein [Bacteroidota bacterium]
MQISLQKIVPSFFSQPTIAGSQIWLQDIVFAKGLHTHIIAPSGTGKTSLIHFLYGLRNDYKGNILYNNEDAIKFDAEKKALWRQQHISIVFQDLRLFTDQTVLQNLEIKRLLNPFHTENKIIEMAGRLGIESKLGKRCSTCSYGEQQRIAIIRSLLQPFDFLLLDEPFSHLDEANRLKAMQLIEEEAAVRNASIILADLKEIEYFKTERKLLM